MTITNLDGVAAGFQRPKPLVKVGITMAAVGSMRGYTPWYHGGNPGASVANAAGINGQAVDDTLGTSVQGRIPRTNPGAGNAHLARLALQASQAGSIWLIDRLWQNSGLSVTSATGQAITPASLPARSGDGTANGAEVMAAVEWSATGGAGTPNVTLSYTDSAGNAGNTTPNMAAVATPPVGTFEMFQLAAGDTGIRSVQTFTQSATRTSGTMHLILFRLLAQLEFTAANVGNALDFITSGGPRIFNDSVLQLVFWPSATTALTLVGEYKETHG